MDAKELIIVGGPNGSGKTTFSARYSTLNGWQYLGADAIAAEIAPGAPETVAFAAGAEMIRRVSAALGGDNSLVIESTLSGRTMRKTIEEAKIAGFAVTVVLIFLVSADECVSRVRQRVLKGGHSVPDGDIRRRYKRSMRNFWEMYRLLADKWVLLYNGKEGMIEVAGGEQDSYLIKISHLFDLYMKTLETGDE